MVLKRDSKGRFVKGSSGWNKGLTGDDYLKHYPNGHPKGRLGKKASESHKAKISKSLTGREVTQETREKISKTLQGHGFADETRSKISSTLMGRYGGDKHWAWKDIDIKKVIELYASDMTTGRIGKAMSISRSAVYNVLRENGVKIRSNKEERAKHVTPVKDTSIEVKIQNFLKELKIEFFTHQYMKIEHGYQCDIFIPSLNMIIECDGDAFHFNPKRYKPEDKIFRKGMTAQERWNLDEARTKELIEQGYNVIRLWECEIKKMDLNDFGIKLGLRRQPI